MFPFIKYLSSWVWNQWFFEFLSKNANVSAKVKSKATPFIYKWNLWNGGKLQTKAFSVIHCYLTGIKATKYFSAFDFDFDICITHCWFVFCYTLV